VDSGVDAAAFLSCCRKSPGLEATQRLELPAAPAKALMLLSAAAVMLAAPWSWFCMHTVL